MMKLTGSLMSKEEEQDKSVSSRHYALCVLNVYRNGLAPSSDEGTSSKVSRRYPEKTLGPVNRLSVTQILLGLLVIGCQLAPLYWLFTLAQQQKNIELYNESMDVAAAGIWAGLAILVTGIVGTCAVNKNARCLIVAQLVLNSFAVLFAIALVGFASTNLGEIVNCKLNGVTAHFIQQSSRQDYYDYRYGDYWKYGTTTPSTSTTTRPSVSIYGETFNYNDGDYQMFYCTHGIFTAWILLELTMAISGLVTLGLTIMLLVKSSKALCLCCRTCCTVDDKEEEADDAHLLSV